MIKACPNLTVLKICSQGGKLAHYLVEKIILKCKKLEIFTFELERYVEPVSINRLVSKMSQNLVHLKQLFLPDLYLSNNNVRLLTKNIPTLKLVRVHDRMFVSASVSHSELQNFTKGSNYKEQGIVETEIF